jgi:ferredoxin
MTDTDTQHEDVYNPHVIAQRCIGCGLCADMMKEVFALNHDKFGIAYVHDPDGWQPDGGELLEETANNCPVAAIVVREGETVGPGGLPVQDDHGTPVGGGEK